MSHFTSTQEATLKIPMAVKFCCTGSCEHPLTTASSAESCLKTCFPQATFTVSRKRTLWQQSQQTNVGNFVLLDIGITVRRTRVKHPVRIYFFSLLWKQYGQRKEKILNHVCLSAVTSKL